MKLSQALRIPILVLAGVALSATAAFAWPSVCDNCYVGQSRLGDPDAQCCLDGRCDFWEDDGYLLIYPSMEWCTSWVTENSAGCNGEAYSCSSGGGGGGGSDECTITVGEWCPPSCSHCFVVF
jgi:hypothetical protein